jgi:hypothetical protein
MPPIRFNPQRDLAPLPFDDRTCRRALQMKADGLKWQPPVGCFVWDPDMTAIDFLRAEGFSEKIIQKFFIPFFSGVCLDPQIRASSRVFQYISGSKRRWNRLGQQPDSSKHCRAHLCACRPTPGFSCGDQVSGCRRHLRGNYRP